MTRAAILLLTAAVIVAALVPVVASAQTRSGTPPPTSSLIVKLVTGLTASEQADVIARNGGIEISAIAALRLHIVQVPTADLATILAQYRADPWVVRAEENKVRRSETVPTDPLYPNQWYLPQINWDLVFGSVTPTGSATVAILDTGIDASHPDLASHGVAGTSILDGSNGMADPNGHGTWMAGIVAAQTNAIPPEGIAGVGFAGVRIMPVTVLDSSGLGQDSDVIAGVIWAADHGADVILMGFSNPGFSPDLQDAIDYAWSRGAILVAATGNGGSNTPTFPAGDRGVIGVSATDAADHLAAFSNYGQAAFLAAPGANIQTTDLGGAYTMVSGTSTSAAIVAGVAAFMKAVDPSLSNGIIVGRMARMADPAGTQEQTGNGRINMAHALADTGTDPVEPAGADPVGAGGPYVGPYVAAASNFTVVVSPSSVTAGSSGNAFTFTFTATNGSAGSNATLVVPTGWTTPQSGAGAGHVAVSTVDCSSASLASISGNTINITYSCLNNRRFQVTYSLVTAPTVAQNYTFTATPTSTSPVVTVNPAAATKLAFTTQPSSGTGGTNLSTQPVVTVQDQFNNTVTTATNAITLAIGTNPSGGTLSVTTNPLSATAGVATFSGVKMDKSGNGYTLTASASGLTGATSNPFNIAVGPAAKLAFGQQPTDTQAASAIPAVTVQIQDAGGNLVTSATNSITMAIGTNPGGGTLSGTTTVAAVNGVATFSNLSINKAASGYTLSASASGLTGTTSTAFNITSGPAAQLTFAQQPTTTQAGANISPAVTVQVQDAGGNLVTTASNPIALAIGTNPGGGTLSGTTTVNAVNGVATFSNLSINKTGNGYTLSATSSGLTGATSNAFNITAAAAAQLVFGVQPSSAQAGSSITPAVTVQIQDQFGNLTTSTASVTAAIGTNPGGGTLSGTTTVNAVSGTASFSNLSINKAASGYTLTVSSTGLSPATSNAFNITAGAAAKLAFDVQPSNTVAGQSISPAVTVQVQDSAGNLVTTSSASIALAIGANPGGGTLGGTTAVAAVNGVATFSNLSINKAGNGYTLAASSAGLTGATSGAFNITAGAASTLVFGVQPSTTGAGSAITPAVTVQIQDGNGNVVTGDSRNVTLVIGTNPGGGTLSGTTTVAASGGVATFSTLSIDKLGTGYTLTATSAPALTGATSAAFNITAGAANKLAFAQQPTTTQAGSTITPAVTVQIQDQFGNLTSSTANVTIAIGANPGGGTLSGTTTVAAANGVATFSNLSINNTGTGYTLAASSAGLTGATSSSFDITPVTTTTTVTSSVNPSVFGQSVTFTASLGGSIGSTRPTGTVTFFDGATVLGTAGTLGNSGNAPFSISSLSAGAHSITAQYGENGSFSGSTSAVLTQTVNKADQTITVTQPAPASAAYNTQFTVAATGGASGQPVVIAASGACSGSGNGSATLTMTSGTGTCTVTYDQAGDSNYSAAPQVVEATTAQQASQTITFAALADKHYGDPDFTVSATAASGLAVTFTASGSCTVTITTVHITGVGSCTITAHQAGDANYSAAPDVPQSFNITDNTPPETTVDNGPLSPTNATTASFTFSGTDDVTAATSLTFECQLDSGGFSACTSPKAYSGLGDGPHTFYVRAKDAAGNTDPTPASFSWTVDTAPPDTILDSMPGNLTNQTTAPFTFHATEPGSTLECQLDGTGFSACASPKAYTGLLDGSHTFDVRAKDQAGNLDPTPATFTWTVDTQAPDTLIDTMPDAITNSNSPAFTFHATEGSTFECSLDGVAYAPCSSPKSYSGLADGSHTFAVRATDPAGNTDPSPASFTWMIDSVAPDTLITAGPADASTTTDTSAMFEFTGSDDVSAPADLTFECSLDGAAFAACTSPQSFSGLTRAPHTFAVRAKDQAGNIDATPATRAWTITQIAQSITVTQHAPGSAVFNTSFNVTATGGASGQPVVIAASGACAGGGNGSATVTMTSGTGTCTVTYNQAGDGNYSAATQVTDTTTAQRAAQSITVTQSAPASAVYNTSFNVAATGGASGQPVVIAASGACSGGGNGSASVTMTSGTGTCTLTYNQAETANYSAAAQVTQTTAAQQASQSITVTQPAPSTAVYNTQFTVSATGGGSGQPVVIAVSGVCSGSGNGTAIITMTSGTGACTVTFNQAGDSNYSAAAQVAETTSAQLAATTTTITAEAPDPSEVGATYTVSVSVTAGSGTPGGTVTVSDGSATCSVAAPAGSCSLTSTTTGTKTLTATYGGDTNFSGSSATAAHEVVDTAPTVAADNATVTVDEGATATNTGTYSDPTPAENIIITASVGTVTKTGVNNGTWRWSYATTDGPAQSAVVTITASDGVNPPVTTTFALTVNNVAPSIANLHLDATSISENQSVMLTGAFTDPGTQDTHTASIDWGDGSATDTIDLAAGVLSFSKVHTYLDNPAGGTVNINVTLSDKDGASATGSVSVTVNDVAPTITSLQLDNASIAEDSSVTLTGTFTDPGTLDTHTVTVDWGDASPVTTLSLAAGELGFSTNHQYLDNGSITINVTVTDKDGLSGAGQVTLNVTDVAPTAAITGAPSSSPEGTAISLGSIVNDVSPVDTAAGFTYTWTVTKNGGAFASAGPAPGLAGFIFTPDDNGSYVVTLTVADKDGLTGSDSQAITVTNVAPTAKITGAPATSPEGTAITLGSTVTDPSSVDTAAGFALSWTVTKNGIGFATGSGTTFGFTPDDNGTYVVTLTATDKDGGAGTDTKTISVQNLPPAVAITGAPASSPEGTAISLGSAVNDSPADVAAGFTYAWSVSKNGNPFPATGSTSSFSFTPDDNGTYVVTFTATDKDGGAGTDSKTIAVFNVAPAVAITGAPDTSPEGAAINLSASVTDPSAADTAFGFTYAWAVTKNGSSFASGSAASFSFTPDDNGTYVVTLTVTDKDGGAGTDSKTITASNVTPTANIVGAPATSPEGTTIALDSTVSDPSAADTAAGFTYAWTVTKNSNPFSSGSGPSLSFTPDDNGTYVVTFTATDKDGAAGTDVKTIIVTNVSPLMTQLGVDATTISEGGTVVLTGTFSDPGVLDTHTVDIDWGDGSAHTTLNLTTGVLTFSHSHLFADNGNITINVTVTDKDGGIGSGKATLTVNDVAPTVSVNLDATKIPEDSPVTLTGSFTDPGVLDTHTVDIDWGDGSAHTTDSLVAGVLDLNPATHTYLDNGNITINVTVTDKDGQSGTASISLNVEDVAPTATIVGAPDTSPEGTPINLSSTATDPSPVDTGAGFVYTWTVTKNGSPFTTAGPATGFTTFSFTPDDNGSYVVILSVADKDGKAGTDTATITVTNVAPSATITGAPAGNVPEGVAVSLGSTVTDVSTVDQSAGFAYAWTVTKDGNPFPATGAGSSFSFTPDDNGTYVVSLAATDKDGGKGTASLTVTVTNVAPTAGITGAPTSSPEGAAISLGSNVADPSTADTAAGFAYAWSVTKNALPFGSGSAAGFTFTPDDNGTYVVTLTATDKDHATSAPDSKTITVTNVAPTANIIGAPTASPEGTAINLGSNVSDPSTADTAAGFTYAWSVTKNGSPFASGSAASFSFTPNDNGSYVVSLVATDKDGGASTPATATINVTNVAPTATFTAPGLVTAGNPITLSLTGQSDPSSADVTAGFTYAFDCGNGSGYSAWSGNSGASCPTPTTLTQSTRTVRGNIRDKDGGYTEYSATVTINHSPVCTQAQASPNLLWPANHQLVPVSITGVTDSDNDTVTINITSVTQDEPVNGTGDGDTSPDAVIQGSKVLIRSERSGNGDGRVYQVNFTASDGRGGSCTGSVKVGVPHDMGNGKTPIDSGQRYNATSN